MVGFPHSEILGSKLIRSSPGLIAAYYVLHRLHAPRHPLDALKALDRSHYRCPQQPPASCNRRVRHRTGTKFATLSQRGVFDRSDQINQNSRGFSVLPGVGSNKQLSHLFTMSKDPAALVRGPGAAKLALSVRRHLRVGIGGADRDRTDDLKLAKLPLSQLSYGPIVHHEDGGPG